LVGHEKRGVELSAMQSQVGDQNKWV